MRFVSTALVMMAIALMLLALMLLTPTVRANPGRGAVSWQSHSIVVARQHCATQSEKEHLELPKRPNTGEEEHSGC